MTYAGCGAKKSDPAGRDPGAATGRERLLKSAKLGCLLKQPLPSGRGSGRGPLSQIPAKFAQKMTTEVLTRAAQLVVVLVQIAAPGFVPAQPATALHWAAHRGDDAAVASLIRKGVDIDCATRYGVTPLALACAAGGSLTAADRCHCQRAPSALQSRRP